jgi:hypothetical protein
MAGNAAALGVIEGVSDALSERTVLLRWRTSTGRQNFEDCLQLDGVRGDMSSLADRRAVRGRSLQKADAG